MGVGVDWMDARSFCLSMRPYSDRNRLRSGAETLTQRLTRSTDVEEECDGGILLPLAISLRKRRN